MEQKQKSKEIKPAGNKVLPKRHKLLLKTHDGRVGNHPNNLFTVLPVSNFMH